MSVIKYLRSPRLIAKKLAWHAIHVGPRRDITVDTANGLLTFDSKDAITGKRLYINRGYERNLIESSVSVLLKDGYLDASGSGTMLDVGANIGMISIALLKAGHFARALAFEPAPGNFRLLEKNVAQNGLSQRVTLYPCALSSAAGELELELSSYNSGDHRIRLRDTPGDYREERRSTVKVPVKTLDGLLAADTELDAQSITMVWLDIQGHEGHFLEGARSLFERAVPVVTEFWPYGILRSGMTRAAFTCITAELFTSVYFPHENRPVKLPVQELDRMWARYSGPKQVSDVILVKDR